MCQLLERACVPVDGPLTYMPSVRRLRVRELELAETKPVFVLACVRVCGSPCLCKPVFVYLCECVYVCTCVCVCVCVCGVILCILFV